MTKLLASTIKEIALEDHKVIPIDSPILVDLDRMIACWDSIHFDIHSDEFVIIQ